MFRPWLRGWLTGAPLLLACSCSVLDRVQDCNAISEVVGRQIEQVKIRLPGADGSSTVYYEIAAAYEALSFGLKELRVRDRSIQRALESYLQSIDQAGRHSRSFAHALTTVARPAKERRKRKARLARIRGKVESERSRTTATYRKLSALCRPR